MKKSLDILKMVARAIGILSFLFIVYSVLFVDDTETETSQNSERLVADSENIQESWEELETFYFADADAKGWDFLTITNSQGEKRDYVKKNNQWVEKSDSGQTNTQVTTPKTNVSKTDDLSTSKLKTGEISSSDLIKVIDNLIGNYNSLISSRTEIKDISSERLDTLVELNEMLSPVLKYDNSCERDWDEWILTTWEKEATFRKEDINNHLKLIQLEEEQIDKLKKAKNNMLEYVTKDYYLNSFNSLETYYKDIDGSREWISKNIENEREVAKIAQQILEKWKTGTDSCSSEYTESYNTTNIYNYKPVVVPQIQIPKTTYCTMGLMSGTQSHYSITCN
ncbi:MAG: hypothetical protein QG551_361 [Patescibacteria group bacterium]|nr:hypothetical protein [Patescibacteria group bacterium]